MKKALLLLGMIAAGAASGGVVAWSILSPAEKNGTHVVTPQSGAVSDDPFLRREPISLRIRPSSIRILRMLPRMLSRPS